MKTKIANSPVVDDHTAVIGSKEEFYSYVEERNNNATWLAQAPARDFKFEPLDCSFTAVLDKPQDYGASAEAYKDTILGTKLAVVDPDGGKHLLRLNALNQAKQRLMIEGAAFNSFSPEQTALVLNTACSVNRKGSLMRIADEKLTAWLSAQSYAVIDSTRVYAESEDAMKQKFGKAPNFRQGVYTHTFMDAIYDIDETNREMKKTIDRYRDAVGDNYDLCISLATSDTGNCAITIDPRLVARNHPEITIPVGGTLRINHKGDKTFEHLHEQFNMLEGALTKGAEMMEKLGTVNVHYAAQALMRALKKVQIPAKQGMEVVMKWDAMHHDQPATALQLFLAAQEVALIVSLEDNNLMKTYRMEDALGRLLGINWGALDYPGDLSWS